MAHFRFHPMLYRLAILWVVACIAPVHPVTAQDDDASELIALINALRAGYGLEPYIVDPGLMALAQEHSEYQASIHTSTHLHSDGRTPPQIGVVENVAGGDLGYLDPQAAVYEIWADPVHGRTMTGYPAGSMGVGVADDGITAYYTLVVRPAGTNASETGTSETGTTPALLTPVPIATLVPATPQTDGSIVHIVGYGQTLWSIALAYGIRIEQIRWWNNIATDSNDIYIGQKLLVRPAILVTASPILPTGQGAQQIGEILVSPTVQPVEGTTTASTPADTPTVLIPTVLHPISTETQAGVQRLSTDSPAKSGLLAPCLAGVSILIGCALLLTLRIKKT